jgi:hypothetical protein
MDFISLRTDFFANLNNALFYCGHLIEDFAILYGAWADNYTASRWRRPPHMLFRVMPFDEKSRDGGFAVWTAVVHQSTFLGQPAIPEETRVSHLLEEMGS